MKKKKFLFILLALIFIYALWLSFLLLRFITYKLPSTYTSPLEIEGVYHIHSTFSDGQKHPDIIASVASLSSLDFIILTDHGNPNFESISSQGWKEGVLVLAGSELSVNRGHLVALGFDLPDSNFSQTAEEAVYQIKALKGFSIIAHPFSKVQWSWGEFIDYSGIEIINADTMLRKDIHRSLPYLPALLIKPKYALLKMLVRPEKNLKRWDLLNSQHPIFGYFSSDAHRLYRPVFSLLRLHLMLKNPLSKDFETAKCQVYDALREGRFFNAIDAAAQAKGFRFWGEKGEKRIQMGKTIVADSPIKLHIETSSPFAKETLLIHNGKAVLRSLKNTISYEAALAGTYRVEVYLKEKSPLGKNIPWILSNPIFIMEKKQ